jgi:hypothetical protein
LRKTKEIKGLRGDALMCVTQAIPQIDAEFAKKDHFGMETSQIGDRAQPIRGIVVFVALLAFVGCGPEPQELIQGTWVIDTEITLDADEQIQKLPPTQKRLMGHLVRNMFEPVQITIGDGTCTYTVGAADRDFPCEVTRVDRRDEVSLRMIRRDGRADFMRARPTDDGRLHLVYEGRPLVMRRP